MAFRITWCTEIVPSLLLIILTLVIPESPKWLASKSRWVEAAKTLTRIRTMKKKKNQTTDKSFVTRAYTTSNKITFCGYDDLFTRKYWRSTISGVILHFFIQFASVTTLMYYFNYICDMCGVNPDRKYWFVSSQFIILGILTIVPVILLDNARRVDFMSYGLLVMSFIFMAKFTILEIFAVAVDELTDFPFNWSVEKEPASAIIALFLFLVSVYSSSITSVSWVFTGEIFPDEARAKGTATCMCVSWMINGLTTLVLPLSFELTGHYVFLVLGCICLVGTICVLQLPETKVKATKLSGLTISSGIESGEGDGSVVTLEKLTPELESLSKTLIKSTNSVTLSPFIDSPLFKLTNKSNDLIVESEEEEFTKSLYENMKSYESPAKSCDDTIENVIESYSADFRSPEASSKESSSFSDWNIQIGKKRPRPPSAQSTSSEAESDPDLPEESEYYRFDNLRGGLNHQNTVRRSRNLLRS